MSMYQGHVGDILYRAAAHTRSYLPGSQCLLTAGWSPVTRYSEGCGRTDFLKRRTKTNQDSQPVTQVFTVWLNTT